MAWKLISIATGSGSGSGSGSGIKIKESRELKCSEGKGKVRGACGLISATPYRLPKTHPTVTLRAAGRRASPEKSGLKGVPYCHNA